ncbi:recombinase family protein [Kribbella speibonae]|uniref:recombinase family protein n=1 Tax=Kribbella speibonae TaxID=1572660 RepID=UPI0023D937E5|nr:recombinase family protein [Kribbella speibonae]
MPGDRRVRCGSCPPDLRAVPRGGGKKAIAELLNREGVPCPSAHAPQQNRHRKMDGWQHSTIVTILDNPRYTGYAVYGRWQKVEELLDPDDVAAGYVVKFRRSPQAKIVRSRQPAHPAIVPVEMFTAVQLEQRRRRAGGKAAWSLVDRRRVWKKRVYAFPGPDQVCDLCTEDGRRCSSGLARVCDGAGAPAADLSA